MVHECFRIERFERVLRRPLQLLSNPLVPVYFFHYDFRWLLLGKLCSRSETVKSCHWLPEYPALDLVGIFVAFEQTIVDAHTSPTQNAWLYSKFALLHALQCHKLLLVDLFALYPLSELMVVCLNLHLLGPVSQNCGQIILFSGW